MVSTRKDSAPASWASRFNAQLFNHCVLALLLVLHAFIVLNFEINWDEFFRLARVYEWKAGTLTAIFESNYVHGFRWLNKISTNEVHQIIAARGVMFGLLIYIIGISLSLLTRLFDRQTALITLIGFLSFSFVLRHATSFRIDLPIIALLMTVIWIIVAPERGKKIFFLAGLFLGLAGAISIKSIFYVPTIAIILLINWWKAEWSREQFIKGLIVGFSAIISFLALTYLHSQSLAKAESALGFIGYASNAAILGYGFFPQRGVLFFSITQNPAYWVILLFGCLACGYDIIKSKNSSRAWICLAGLLPMISLVIYVHTYIYFYTYLLAAASLVFAYGLSKIIKRYHFASFVIPIILLIGIAPVFIVSMKQTKDYQLQVNDVVHKMFPQPVNYIDRTSQISTFPKQGLFMTAVQMDEYKTQGIPVIPSVFDETPPEFLLANIESLDLDRIETDHPTRRYMAEDETILKENFIHHWGPIYVPGKTIKAQPIAQNIEIKLAGTYTIESEGPVMIDGKSYAPMDTLFLKKGPLSISSSRASNVTLRKGDNLYRPRFEPLGKIIFHGF